MSHTMLQHFLLFCGHESLRDNLQVQPTSQDFMQNDTFPTNQVELKTMRRKASLDLNLDLSLKLSLRNIIGDHQKQGNIEDHFEVGSNLSLFLYTQSSYDEYKEQEKRIK
ncbi:hypothetical protein RYX36_029815 [Vicia faba]